MIYQHTWEWVIDKSPHTGEPKTQTRRLATGAPRIIINGETFQVESVGQWKVGKSYAVQPGRGKHAVGRITILRLWAEDAREISDVDVRAGGYADKIDFMRVWVKMHDLTLHRQEYWGLESAKERPEYFYKSWAIEFEREK